MLYFGATGMYKHRQALGRNRHHFPGCQPGGQLVREQRFAGAPEAEPLLVAHSTQMEATVVRSGSWAQPGRQESHEPWRTSACSKCQGSRTEKRLALRGLVKGRRATR